MDDYESLFLFMVTLAMYVGSNLCWRCHNAACTQYSEIAKIPRPFSPQVQESVEEVENSGFLATSSTLDVKLMANNKILQVKRPVSIILVSPTQSMTAWFETRSTPSGSRSRRGGFYSVPRCTRMACE